MNNSFICGILFPMMHPRIGRWMYFCWRMHQWASYVDIGKIHSFVHWAIAQQNVKFLKKNTIGRMCMCVALPWLQTSGLYLLHSYYHVVFTDLYPLGHATQSIGMFFLSIILWKKMMRYTIVIYQIRGLLLKTWRIWTWSTYLEQRYKYMTKIAKRSATERPSVIQMYSYGCTTEPPK